MAQLENRIIVKTRTVDCRGGFDIVLEFSGVPEVAFHQRHNALLHQFIGSGISLDALRRKARAGRPDANLRARNRANDRLRHSLLRLLADLDLYLTERGALRSAFKSCLVA